MGRDGILFLKLRDDLARRIAEGEFPLDSQLPTEAALVKHYGVSITTVRKAVQALSDEGIASKRQGMGTFVSKYPGAVARPPEKDELLKIAVLLPDTTRLTREGDSRHWALNLRRLNGICSAAAKRHCQVFVQGLNEKINLEELHGVIMIASYAYSLEAEDARLRLAAELDAKGIPYATVSEFDPRFASRLWVAEMTETEFYLATSSLIKKGHKRIALLGPSLDWKNPRYLGYVKALHAHGIELDLSLKVENPESDEPSGRKACAKLLDSLAEKSLPSPDAIFCTTDLQAYGAMACLAERGLRVPEDISVMGVDNLPESASGHIPLASLEFSGPEVGEAALELLIDSRRGLLPNGRMLSCPGRIIWRVSVADKAKREG